MPKYKYTATDAAGAQVTGVLEGATPTAVGLALMDRDLAVSALSEHRGIMQFEITKKRVPRKELMQFSRQLAVFLRSGIPVIDALEVIQEELPKKSLFRDVLQDMIEGLRAGSTLTAVVRAHPEAFPNFYAGVINAAELVTHRFPLEDAPHALEVASHPAPGVLKVVLQGVRTGLTAR